MAKLYDGELRDLELMAWNTRTAAAATKVRRSEAPWGPLPPPRAPSRHHVPRLPSFPAIKSKQTEPGLSTAPACLHSSSRVPFSGRAALGLGAACPEQQPR